MKERLILKSFYIKLYSIIIISCLGILVYSNTFLCSFHFDDIPYIVNNHHIRNIQNLLNIWKFCPCRFVTFLSIAFNYHCHQLNVFGYHLFNIAVHVGSAILVWWLTLLTFSTPAMKEEKIARHANPIALFAGLVFVSHPVQIEAVTYIWQRAASMATLFYLASLGLYVKSRLLQDKKSSSGRWEFYYISSLIMAIMAMFTKEIAITLPLMILLYEFTFLNTKKSLNWKRLSPFLLAIFIIPLTMLFTKSDRFQEIQGVVEGPGGISPIDYLLTQFRVTITYIRLVFLPLNLNLAYDYPIFKSIFELPVLISFLFLIAILFSAKKMFSKYRLISFSIFWFFLTLLPESSFLPQKDVIFEHRLYLPLVGYSMFLVSSAYYLFGPHTGHSSLFGKKTIGMMAMALIMVISCYSVLTYQRNKVWEDEFTLWDDTARKSPHNVRPHNNRGIAFDEKNNLAQAMLDFNKAIEIDPKNADAYDNRGIIYGKQSHFTQAISDFNKAVEINPNYVEAYNNRGLTYYSQGNLAQAMSDYNKAIEIDPEPAKTYNYRGLIYYKQGNYAQALSDYNRAIAIDSNYAMAYYNRGLGFYNQGNLIQALSDYNKAIEINPNYAQAYDNRGVVYYKQGKFTQALSDYTRAIAIDPKLAEAYIDRGISYEHQGNLSQAISDYNKAIEIDPPLAKAYNYRGLIYYKQGNYTQALSDYNKAIKIDPNNAEVYNNRGSFYGNQGDLTQAMSDFDKAIEINPQYVDAYNNRATGYYALNEYDKAWADVRKAEELGAVVNPDFINKLKQASQHATP